MNLALAMASQQSEMTLALTFDDGPDPVWTPRLLDLLSRAAGPGSTFFPIAPRAAAQPALIARMLAEGHAVGLHCDEHVRHSTRDIDWGRRDTARALARLSALGVRPSLWRTPWGDVAPWSEAWPRARAAASWAGRSTRTTGAATPRPRCSAPPGRSLAPGRDRPRPRRHRSRRAPRRRRADARVRRRSPRRTRAAGARRWRRWLERSRSTAEGPRRRAPDGRSSEIAAGAARARRRAAAARFPKSRRAARSARGARLQRRAGPTRPPAAAELELVRAVARADGSVGRIFDGHLNAVERLAVQGPAELRDRELAAVHAGRCAPASGAAIPFPARARRPRSSRSTAARCCAGSRRSAPGAGGLRPRAGPRPRPGRAARRSRSGSTSPTAGASRSTRLVPRARPARLGLAPRGVPRRAGARPLRRARGALPSSRGSARDALRTAASWAGMADTARATARSTSSPPARSAARSRGSPPDGS